MAKRKRENNEKQNEKRNKEGRGQGRLDQYKPWLKIQDVGSIGLSTRVKGWKTNRIHHFLSKLELSCFYLFEWSENISDIREQFPLDLDETKAIAQELGINHPADPKTKEPIVMTTDFLITIKSQINAIDVARTVKYSKDLNNKRTLEKFEMERVYWHNREIDWSIITEREINSTIVENIKIFYSHRNLQDFSMEITPQFVEQFFELTKQFLSKNPLLQEIIRNCSSSLNLPHEISLAIFYHLAANHRINIDITQPINPRKKVYLQNSIIGGELL